MHYRGSRGNLELSVLKSDTCPIWACWFSGLFPSGWRVRRADSSTLEGGHSRVDGSVGGAKAASLHSWVASMASRRLYLASRSDRVIDPILM